MHYRWQYGVVNRHEALSFIQIEDWSHEYQKILILHGLICSMSKRGDCFDNASMESWNHSFNVEAIHGEKFITRTIAINHVFEYIEIYYNRKRLHSQLGYKSPELFEAKWLLSKVSDFSGKVHYCIFN